MTEIAIVYTTVGNMTDAESLASKAVESGHAKCVNIMPSAKSVYVWEGAVQKEDECLMVFKTAMDKLSSLAQFIENNHPYDTPAILKFNPKASDKFLAYINA